MPRRSARRSHTIKCRNARDARRARRERNEPNVDVGREAPTVPADNLELDENIRRRSFDDNYVENNNRPVSPTADVDSGDDDDGGEGSNPNNDINNYDSQMRSYEEDSSDEHDDEEDDDEEEHRSGSCQEDVPMNMDEEWEAPTVPVYNLELEENLQRAYVEICEENDGETRAPTVSADNLEVNENLERNCDENNQEQPADQIFEADEAIDATLIQMRTVNEGYQHASTAMPSINADIDAFGNNILQDDLLYRELFGHILCSEFDLLDFDQDQDADMANMIEPDWAGDSGNPPNTEHESLFDDMDKI